MRELCSPADLNQTTVSQAASKSTHPMLRVRITNFILREFYNASLNIFMLYIRTIRFYVRYYYYVNKSKT